MVVLDTPLNCRQHRPWGVRARLLRWQSRETKFLGQTWKEDMSVRLAKSKVKVTEAASCTAQHSLRSAPAAQSTPVSLASWGCRFFWKCGGIREGWQENLGFSQGASSLINDEGLSTGTQKHLQSQVRSFKTNRELSLGQLLFLDSHNQPKGGYQCHGFGAGCLYSVF